MDYSVKNTLLKIDDVSLSFGNTLVLKNVKQEIKDIVGHGQIVSLLGPSGIGKTQLFRIMAGLNAPTSGQVLIGEEQTPVHQGLVGVVQQHYPLMVHRTVLDNLVFVAIAIGKEKKVAIEEAKELLSRFKLTAQSESYPAQLSGGQRQRVAIAQQLICSSHFLLMDEPYSGLDPIMNDEVCSLFAEVASMHELNTIIVITHDIRSAVKVADTLWLLGRDRDENDLPIPGAYIKQSYDLIERDLAWHQDITKTRQFAEFIIEVKDQFQHL